MTTSTPKTPSRMVLIRRLCIVLAVLLVLAAIALPEVRRYRALRDLEELLTREEFRPMQFHSIVEVESRLPEWIQARIPRSISDRWFVAVKTVWLNGIETRIAGAGERVLADASCFPELEDLRVRAEGLTTEGLRGVRFLPKLRNVELACTSGEWPTLPAVHWPVVQFVNLSRIRLPDETLASLSQSPRIEFLTLYNAQTSGRLAFLAGLPHLRSLQLVGVPAKDGDLAVLGRLLDLEFLILSRAPVQGPGLASLKSCRNLTGLHLEDLPLRGDALAMLSSLPALASLDLIDSSGPGEPPRLMPGEDLRRGLNALSSGSRLSVLRISSESFWSVLSASSGKPGQTVPRFADWKWYVGQPVVTLFAPRA